MAQYILVPSDFLPDTVLTTSHLKWILELFLFTESSFSLASYPIFISLGKDYRQPAPALFKPARKIVVQKKNSKFEDEDDEMIIERDSDSESAVSPKPKIYGYSFLFNCIPDVQFTIGFVLLIR